MPVLGGFIAPHPPLIIPEIGRGKEREIQKTIDSYHTVAQEIAALEAETVVIISPHSTLYADYIHISPGKYAFGNLCQFGAKEEYRVDYDSDLISELSQVCEQNSFPAGTLGEKDKSLDHGTLVPLYFIRQYCKDFKLVRISISGLSRQEHYEFGMHLRQAADKLGRKIVIIASGDMSHKLTEDGPYGFNPDGPKLDAKLVEIMRSGDFGAYLDLDETMCENAAECGLRSFIVMSGAFDKKSVEPTFYSYEGPFGVGYGIAAFKAKEGDSSRDFLTREKEKAAAKMRNIRDNEDAYVKLARATLETYVNNGGILPVPEDLPHEMLDKRAGIFVSIKKRGELRGCIGTTSPTRENIAREIIGNAIESGTGDPRFPPVRPDELDELVYSVDVLSRAESVSDKSELDVTRYGVIVTKGTRRGLLLPNLEGVDAVDDQLAIACQKAGIPPHESYDIQRFEVVRHK